MPGCVTISTPIRPRQTDASRLFVTQRRILGQQSAKYLPRHLWIFYHHRRASHGTSLVMVRLCCEAEPESFAISCLYSCLVSIGFYLLFLASIPLCFLAFSTRRMLS